MSNYIQSILSGVIANFITTPLFLFIGYIYREKIFNWYKSIKYSGPSVAGSWKYLSEGKSEFSATLDIYQNGQDLAASYSSVDKGKSLVCHMEGAIKNSHIFLIERQDSAKERPRLTISGVLEKDGKSITGFYSIFQIEEKSLMTRVLLFKR